MQIPQYNYCTLYCVLGACLSTDKINFQQSIKVYGLLMQHVEELMEYLSYGLWWIALGVASSIGLGEQHLFS